MDAQTPDNALIRFLRSKAAIPVGFIIAAAIGIYLMSIGLCSSSVCCGLGPLILAILMFFVVKLFNGKSTKLLIVFAAIFFLASTAVGALAFSSPMIDDNTNYNGFNSGNFTNPEIVCVDDTMTVTVSYSGEGSSVELTFSEVAWVSYNNCGLYNEDRFKHAMADVGGGTYAATFDISKGNIYGFKFISKNADGNTVDESKDTFYLTDGFNKTTFCLMKNAYYTMLPSILFVLIAFITLWLRKRLEKEREKMEAEGRLYPEGYGRCKECGSIVLPGEVSCRKCGAYVDVPENMRVKKADTFFCTDCGAEVPGDAVVCPKCGAKFDEETETIVVEANETVSEDSFQCTDCGAIVPADAKVCPKCGAKFDEDEETQPQNVIDKK